MLYAAGRPFALNYLVDGLDAQVVFAGQDALAVDGKLGPKTENAVRKVCALSPSHSLALATAVLERRSEYYKELARQDRFKPFPNGWPSSVTALWEFLHELHKKGVA